MAVDIIFSFKCGQYQIKVWSWTDPHVQKDNNTSYDSVNMEATEFSVSFSKSCTANLRAGDNEGEE